MHKLSEAQLTVVTTLQERRQRLRHAREEFDLMMSSQRVDALYLVDQGDVPKIEICLYAGISRPTLDKWIADRDSDDGESVVE